MEIQSALSAYSAQRLVFVPVVGARAASQGKVQARQPQLPATPAQPSDEVDFSPEAQALLGLSTEEQAQVDKLKARDREVRAHEQAHLAAAGPYARGGPTYTYQRGPDGGRYAIGGQVQIDTSPVEGDPEATIRKAQVVRAAALAPAEPSSQDRKVAAAASKMEAQARAEMQTRQFEQRQEDGDGQANPLRSNQDYGESPTYNRTAPWQESNLLDISV